MQILKCIIIEDEALAADVLRDYILDCRNLELVSVCTSAIDAMEVLRKKDVDVLFVDIELPKLSGIDFVKTILNRYHIIFTTAYHQYAIEGFNVNAVDYLLKPIEFSRFMTAIQKVFERLALPLTDTNSEIESVIDSYPKNMFFNVDKKQIKVSQSEILYIESVRDFIFIHLENQKILVRYKISALEEILPEKHFVRVHKSFIINLNNIRAFSAGNIEVGNKKIPIGRTFKNKVHEILNSFGKV